jgi:hypothetical protein
MAHEPARPDPRKNIDRVAGAAMTDSKQSNKNALTHRIRNVSSSDGVREPTTHPSNPHRQRLPIAEAHPVRGFLPWALSVACL